MPHLDNNKLYKVADVFKHRFPDAKHRAPILAAAKLREPADPQKAWLTILHEAQQRGRIRSLAVAAHRQRPDDESLTEACRAILPPSRMSGAVAVASGVACAFVVAIIAASVLRAPSVAADDRTVAAEPVSLAAVADVTPARADLPPKPEPARTAPPAEPTPAQEPAVIITDNGNGVPLSLSSRCQAPDGELIGYWYTGTGQLGAAGDTIVVPTTSNVRVAYPSEQNGHSARAKVRCLIVAGDRVTLSADPIAALGGYWTPLHGGDLR